MSDQDDKTKISIHINPFEDYAIVQQFYSDDGLFDGESYAEWQLLQEQGDRADFDYADYEVQTGDCD